MDQQTQDPRPQAHSRGGEGQRQQGENQKVEAPHPRPVRPGERRSPPPRTHDQEADQPYPVRKPTENGQKEQKEVQDTE